MPTVEGKSTNLCFFSIILVSYFKPVMTSTSRDTTVSSSLARRYLHSELRKYNHGQRMMVPSSRFVIFKLQPTAK